MKALDLTVLLATIVQPRPSLDWNGEGVKQ